MCVKHGLYFFFHTLYNGGMSSPSITLDSAARQRLREARRAHGMTIPKLADACGYHTNTIARVELGTKNPSAELLTKLCEVLGLEWQRQSAARIKRRRRTRMKTAIIALALLLLPASAHAWDEPLFYPVSYYGQPYYYGQPCYYGQPYYYGLDPRGYGRVPMNVGW